MKHLLTILLISISSLILAQDKNPPVTEIKIVSWNIQMLPTSLQIFSKHLRKKQKTRTPWIVEYCKEQDFDIIVFQEVFDRKIKRKLKRKLKSEYPYIVNTKTKFGRFTSNGILFMSKVPITYKDHVIYKKGVIEDRMAAKGCTLVEGNYEGVKFQVAGTHLQAGGGQASIMHRSMQFADIRTLLDRNTEENIPVFVAGDMNTSDKNEDKYNYMLKTLDVKDFPVDEERRWTADGRNSWNPGKGDRGSRIDYIFLNDRGTKTTVIKQNILRPTKNYKGEIIDLADHYGVLVKVRICNQ